MLKPHKNLKMLTIKQYSGSQLSSWIGDPTFSNLFSLCLSCCKNCTSLPALGQLSSLEHLTIEGMEGVKVVGPEFCGCSSSFQPFKSLATLRFEDMLQWEEWSAIGMEEGKDFPHLHTLFIQRCPKLRGELPKFLPSLESLEIHSCQKLASLPRLPLVCKIVLEECNNLVVRKLAGLSSLSFLSIRKILDLKYLPEAVLQQSTALEEVEITDCDDLTSVSSEAGLQTLVSLQSLLVENCEQFVSLLAEDRGLLLPPGLKYLKLSNCPNLEKLPSMLHCLTSLEKVSIHKFPQVQSFPIEGFPSMIKSLNVTDCHALESLPKGMVQNNLSIELLKIEGCSSLTSFPSGQLPTSLKTLEILDCTNFKSLPEGMIEDHPSLESLSISGCHCLTSFPRDGLRSPSASSSSPSSIMITTASKLRRLEIFNCENLVSLAEVLHVLGSLIELSIRSCPGLVSISGEVLPHSKLKLLMISGCNSLLSLPDRISNLTHLQILAITDCPSLVSLPEGGLPTDLKSLCIEDCNNLNHPSRFGLHRLTSLRELIIGGCPGLVSLLKEGLLPSTLTSLHITRFPNLESLDIASQNLNSLHSLTIWECDKLMSLPDKELPISLSYLTICFCPLLQLHYKDGEKDRSKISHIAYINIDDQVNPSEELPIPELDQIDGSPSFSHRIYSTRKLKIQKIGSTH